MKCYTFIDEKEEERVLIYSHERNELVLQIESLVKSDNTTLTAKYNEEIYKINPLDVNCFIAEDNKTYALIGEKRYVIKERLYMLEKLFNNDFIKINQSCLGNIKRISKFSPSLGGALMVTFKNNYTDYVSRRELKAVKERLGL